MSEYITIAGIVQFDPRTRQAGDKEVRDVVIRAIGSNKNFSITNLSATTIIRLPGEDATPTASASSEAVTGDKFPF